MGLRLLLVGLVTSLGFEWPAPGNVARWVETGRVWVVTQWDRWVPALPNGEEAFASDDEPAICAAVSAETASPVVSAPVTRSLPREAPAACLADDAFAAVVDTMVADFAPDLAPRPAPPERAAVAWEPVELGDDLYPGLAYELNRQGERTTLSDTPEPDVSCRDRSSDHPSAAPPTSTERLARAVHLTREALHAWATLLQAPTVVSVRP
jgi:hypothetical protein